MKEKLKEAETDTVRSSIHWFTPKMATIIAVGPQDGHDCQGWARSKASARDAMWFSHVAAGVQLLQSSDFVSPGTLNGSWIASRALAISTGVLNCAPTLQVVA